MSLNDGYLTKKERLRAELAKLVAEYDGEICRSAGQRVQVRCECCKLAYMVAVDHALRGAAARMAWRSRRDFQFAAGHLDAVQRAAPVDAAPSQCTVHHDVYVASL
jgi:hypothetical protein